MHSIKVLSAVGVIGAQLVAGQASACRKDFTVTSIAQASAIPCTTLEKDLIVDSDVSGNLVIDGVVRIKGSLIITNASSIESLSSPRLATIDTEFHLEALTEIRTIEMSALTDIGSIKWLHLPALSSIRLGQSGVTSAKSVEISDTALASLDEFKVSSVDTMRIDNNNRLVSYSATLGNVTQELTFSSNGANLAVSLPDLIWANNLGFQDVGEVELPSLQYINDSLRFDQGTMTSFTAPNLTTVEKGDLALIGNLKLGNLSFPLLEKIGGSLTLINNTALEEVFGFPELTNVGGAVRLGGNFQNVSLPSLKLAAGDFTILSTEDITSTCDEFKPQAGNEIEGKYVCSGKEQDANNEDNVNNGGSGSNGGTSNDNGNGVGSVSASMLALLAAIAVGVLAQL